LLKWFVIEITQKTTKSSREKIDTPTQHAAPPHQKMNPLPLNILTLITITPPTACVWSCLKIKTNQFKFLKNSIKELSPGWSLYAGLRALVKNVSGPHSFYITPLKRWEEFAKSNFNLLVHFDLFSARQPIAFAQNFYKQKLLCQRNSGFSEPLAFRFRFDRDGRDHSVSCGLQCDHPP